MNGIQMDKLNSKLASGRQNGKHQIDWQRDRILDIAQKLFLQNGLKNVRMGDIAAESSMTKMTLYRYFSNIDEIAVLIHERMLAQIAAQIAPEDLIMSFESLKKLAHQIISNFNALRDAYCYVGMFDSLYMDNPPGTPVTEWMKTQLGSFPFGTVSLGDISRDPNQGSHFAVILNNLTWFLEKLAMRGELTWSNPSIPLEEHLKNYEEMVMLYIDAHSK
jgi:AcrR family transcriptional regulator